MEGSVSTTEEADDSTENKEGGAFFGIGNQLRRLPPEAAGSGIRKGKYVSGKIVMPDLPASFPETARCLLEKAARRGRL